MKKHGLGGQIFERGIEERFQRLGWNVSRTPVVGDFGADLIARVGTELLVVQCKDYGSPVGISAIQEIHFARSHYGATSAAVVARNGFTKAAIHAASSTNVQILLPTDLDLGCSIDRTRQRPQHFRDEEAKRWEERQHEEARRRRERQHQLDEIERFRHSVNSKLWREYDKELQAFESKAAAVNFRKSFIVLALIAIVSFTIFVPGSGTKTQNRAPIVVSEIGIALGLWYLCCKMPVLPDRPFPDRKGAQIVCGECRQKLRVDYGRDGTVQCPHCSSQIAAHT